MTKNNSALRERLPLRALIAPFALFALAGASQAQTAATPNFGIGDALKEAQPPRPPTPGKAPAPVIVQPEEPPLSLPAGETLTVHEFKFDGARFIPEAELQAVLAPYKDRALTLAGVEEAAGKLTALYRSRGYLVARAYVPRQNASAGTLTLRILVGKFDRYTLDNRSRVSSILLDRVFAALPDEEAISKASLERAMLLVSDMPGAQMPRLTIAPGQAPGSSDLAIDVPEGKRFAGYALADNQGSRYTGRNRLSAGLDVNSPFGVADKLALNAMLTNGGGLANGRLGYGFPLAANGLRGEVAVSKTTYELGSDYRDLDATGSAHSVEAALSYPLLRGRDQNLIVSVNVAAKQMRDEVKATNVVNPKQAKFATLALQHEAWSTLADRATYTSANLGITQGRLEISDATQEALNKAGANTVGNYGRLNLGASASIDLPRDWSASATAGAQKALRNKNLDPSEQMAISGSGGVKAYREWVSGDNVWLIGAELRRALPGVDGLTHSLALFGDVGRASLQNGSYASVNGTRLSDVGLGYAARYQSLIGKLQVARTVGPQPKEVGDVSSTRVLLQIGATF